MTIALKSPEKISNIIAVDNAPIDAVLASGFGSYVRGMKKIANAKVTRLSEADKILQEVEEVCLHTCSVGLPYSLTGVKVSTDSTISAWKPS